MEMKIAYSMLTVKSVNEEKRIITGIASTPTPDRMSDIVEPKGAEFKLPIPLLWQHDSSQPIGHVTSARVTAKGIEVTAKIVSFDEPGRLKDRLDEAWHSIKSGLVAGFSIGFKGLETAFIGDTFGIRYIKWLWLELSAVTIPANGEATITSIKSIDTAARAAIGLERNSDPPGDSGKSSHKSVVVKLEPERTNKVNTAESIKSFEEARASKAARMSAIMEETGAKGETLDAESADEYDNLEAEVKKIDTHLDRLRKHEAVQAASAKPVLDGKDASKSRDPQFHNTVKAPPKLGPGIRFARFAKCLALAQGNRIGAVEVAKSLYGDRDPLLVETLKANVLAGSTVTGNWGANLVGDETSAFADFIEFLRPMTILGKFGANGVPNLRRVPFRVALAAQTSGGEGYWVGEGKAKPVTSFDFSRTTLEPLKVANIAVVTMELLRDSSPSAEGIIRDQLAAALQQRMDIDFIDPAKAAVAGVSPASILNGVAAIASVGNTADNVRTDLRALFAAFIAANNAPTSGVWIMPATVALALSLMQNPLGQPEFPAINMTGGTFSGLPVIVSENMPSVSGGAYVALVNAQDIYLADEGGIDVDMSREASLQMLDNPTNDSVTPTATTLVSLWQTNSVGFRAERTINWARRRTSSVAYLSSVDWGE